MRNRKLLTKHYDVVVVGGGLAGVCVAIASARHGARTAIVQARPMFGGTSSSEIRMHICGASCHAGKRDLYESGIILELLLENKSRNPCHSFSIWDTVLWEKTRYQKNLDIFLNTSFESARVDNNRILGIHLSQINTEREYDLSAHIFVDATGNGMLGYLAGAEFRMGSESRDELNEKDAPKEANGYTMGNTIMFTAEDMGRPVAFKKPFWAHTFSEEDLRQRGHGNMTIDRGKHGIVEEYSVDSGYWWIEWGGKCGDIIDQTEEITEELYKCVFGVWDHIKNGGDHGAANHAITWVGSVPGLRESRRLIGDYIINENDVLANRIFEDAVAYGGWPMDVHDSQGIYSAGLPSDHINFPGCYTIPYRCYYSVNIANLMMAGRDISASKMAFSSTRVMGTCAVGGQAVGLAASLAVRYGITPREMGSHIRELQQLLLKDDCYIPGCRNEDEKDLARQARVTASSHREGYEPTMVVSGVSRQVGDISHCWESMPLTQGDAILTFTFEKPKSVYELRIFFDPDFNGELMPSLTKRVQQRECRYLPEVLVKDYDVRAYWNDAPVWEISVRDNVQRLNVLPLSETMLVEKLEINVIATYGHDAARIFEVRIY